MAVVPPSGNTLRAALKAKRWSYSRLAVELRRQATRDGVTVPKHESLITLITRWVNNRQQPDAFYRGLLSRTLGLPEGELFDETPQAAELAAGAEPWLLARALDASAVGGRSLDLLEAAVADFARRYPSAAPAELLGPVREHYRDAVRLLAGPLRIAHRRRLSAAAGVLGGLAGSLSFDLQDQARAAAYFQVARQAAEEAEDHDLGAWALATWSRPSQAVTNRPPHAHPAACPTDRHATRYQELRRGEDARDGPVVPRRGVRGEETSSPRRAGHMDRPGRRGAVGARCPAVKRECPAPRRRAGRSGAAIRA